MTRQGVYQFVRGRNLAVLATIAPEAALIGIAATPELEIVFDTIKTTGKYQNLLQNSVAPLVIGWDNEVTVQYEGETVQLFGKALDGYQTIYFTQFSDGPERAAWPDIAYSVAPVGWFR